VQRFWTSAPSRRSHLWRGVVGSVCAGVLLLPGSAATAQGGTVTGTKTVSDTDISCNGSTNVTVTLEGQTGISGQPADIMLVLDRSGSMQGAPIANLKSGALSFVDIIDEGTDNALNGLIANGSRIGVVSFADSATVNQPLTGDAGAVKSAINGLGASGATNHSAAFQVAQAQLAASQPANQKILIIFTDGVTTVGGDASDDAAAARAAGTEVYAIGLGSVNVGELNDWATDPDSQHVFIAPSAGQLEAIFQAIGAAIVVPAATNITVVDTVNSHFAVSNATVTAGTIGQAGNVLTWTIPQLNTETVTLSFTATHSAAEAGGAEQVNAAITYTDAEGHAVSFPSPTVNVRGCAATIEVTPPTADNELGTPGQTHTVNGAIADDFGDPVDGVTVDFSVLSGPNAGASGSGTTVAGTTPFTYTAAQGLAGLGTDTVQGCFTNGAGVAVCDTAVKNWIDTTPPVVACPATTNPSGSNVPQAGNNPASGQNPDGFYEVTSSDAVDPNPTITVHDTASSATFGPFASGTKLKLTQAPGSQPSQRPGPGGIDWHITTSGDAAITATDASGNTSASVLCQVAPPPK
jgi:uncharacterized protein YegL